MKVHHITPGATDKNLGKSINTLIEPLPSEDWICLRDIDTMPLHHRVFFKQCEDIASRGGFGIVGCITNRIGMVKQLHNGALSEDYNLLNHIRIAEDRYNRYGSEVIEHNTTLAGVMMLFSKKVWLDVGGFREGGIMVDGAFIDYHFSNDVINKGYKLGLARGIYVFHVYRQWLKNTRVGYNHLF